MRCLVNEPSITRASRTYAHSCPRGLPLTHCFVHLQLYVGLEAEELVWSRGGERFGAVCEEEEIVEEESPQLPAAFGFVKPAAVQQLARPEAVRQRVEDQVLEGRGEEGEW